MKKFLKENGIWILAAAVAVCLLLNLIAFFSANTNILYDAAEVITSPFRSAATAVSQWISENTRYRSDFDALKAENEALKTQLAQIEQALRQAELDSQENKLLRNLLGLQEQRRDLTGISSAKITGRSHSNWDDTLTLGVGRNLGVEIGQCVIDDKGYLVGTVDQVGQNWSRVRTIRDPQWSMGALVFRSGEIGVCAGDFSLLPEQRLKMSYVSDTTDIIVGDLIVSSGLNAYYPTGLSIGTVIEIRNTLTGSGRTAILQPFSALDDLTEVFIVQSFDIVE